MSTISQASGHVIPHRLNALASAPRMLSHAAYVAHDAAETVDFYTRVLGMELVNAVISSQVNSTKDSFPYFHIFFRLGDGSTFAFFIVPGLPQPSPPSHPAYDIFNHIAFHADSEKEVLAWKQRLEGHGIEIIGPVNHAGKLLSIYFRDPNNVRLEITTPLEAAWNDSAPQAYAALKDWCTALNEAKASGGDVCQTMIEHITVHQTKAQ